MIEKIVFSRNFKRCFLLMRGIATQFFVPKHEVARTEDIEKVQEFLNDKPRILVLTGAGISTESGGFSSRKIFKLLE